MDPATLLRNLRAAAVDYVLVTGTGIGTQIDGLAHLGIDHRYYNGNPAQELFRPTGVTKFGTHEFPPIVGEWRQLLAELQERVGGP